jgi:hypothetical protein
MPKRRKPARPEWLEEDLRIHLGWALPGTDEQDYDARISVHVDALKEVEGEELPTWEAVLKCGVIVRLVKPVDYQGKMWRCNWFVTVDGEKIRRNDWCALRDALEKRMLSPIDRYKAMVDRTDWTASFSDDGRVWRAAESHRHATKALLAELPADVQAEAEAYYKAKHAEVWGDA